MVLTYDIMFYQVSFAFGNVLYAVKRACPSECPVFIFAETQANKERTSLHLILAITPIL